VGGNILDLVDELVVAGVDLVEILAVYLGAHIFGEAVDIELS